MATSDPAHTLDHCAEQLGLTLMDGDADALRRALDDLADRVAPLLALEQVPTTSTDRFDPRW